MTILTLAAIQTEFNLETRKKMDVASLVLLLCSLFLLFTMVRRVRQGRNPPLPPSPWSLPLIGNFHQFIKNPHQSLHSLAQKHGPIMLLHFGMKPFFVISSGKLTRELIKNDLNFLNRPQTKPSQLLFAGRDDLLFSPHGHFWKSARKICVNELLSVKRVHSFRHIYEEEVARMVTEIRNSSLVNTGNLFRKLSTDINSRALIGERSRNGVNYEGNIGELTQRSSDLLSEFSFAEFIPALWWIDYVTGFTKRGMKISKEMHEFLDRVIDEHESRISKNDSQSNYNKDLVDVMLELRGSEMTDNFDLTRINIRSILVDLFVGGIDNTTVAMEWAMAELMKNPGIMTKVQDEIRSVIGEKTVIQESDINQMEYLKCVMKESLRLHCPSLTGREASKSVVLGGYEIPAKAIVLINIWSISRDPVIWDRPLEFRPERFLKCGLEYIGQETNYYPFGLGRRICPGDHFALAEAEYALANVLCWFDWKLPDGMTANDMDMSEGITLNPRKKTPLSLIPIYAR